MMKRNSTKSELAKCFQICDRFENDTITFSEAVSTLSEVIVDHNAQQEVEVRSNKRITT